jgi:hypothetical protein
MLGQIKRWNDKLDPNDPEQMKRHKRLREFPTKHPTGRRGVLA